MLDSLRRALLRPLAILGLLCMFFLILFHESASIYYYLTLAQLVFVPIIIEQLVTLKYWQKIVMAIGQLAVTILYFTQHEMLIFFRM